MKKITVGILAHVDAGKTTLSEAILYTGGAIRKAGRVDNRDAFLDTYALERERGITIFSKQAEIPLGELGLTLLDTPGHTDFSAEMERTLKVLDYAVLVVSGADGVQGHTQTLWKLLSAYQVPTFIFVNKMDQNGVRKDLILEELKSRLSDSCIDFNQDRAEQFYEELAVCEDEVLEEFLEYGQVAEETIRRLITERKLFPCYFGSALRLQGIDAFMEGLRQYIEVGTYPEEFGAKVYKITRDPQGNRLTHLKITGGSLRVRAVLKGADWEEKVNQIRIYSGEKYEVCEEVPAGWICAVTGLTKTFPGEGLGTEQESQKPVLEPVLTYQMILPPELDAAQVLPKLRELEEEEPELAIVWEESLREIQVQIMGDVQIEILRSRLAERFGFSVDFASGNILYKETITNCVEGVGHFEPLKHYAEVHLLMEPGESGSGLAFRTACGEEMLEGNWQRLVLTHLHEKRHRGVLTGAEITDMIITLVGGRAHQKHTEGGDFREATYRAVRQGLMEAQCVLLEPYYDFRLEVPQASVGKALADMDWMAAVFEGPEVEGDMSVLTGQAPVSRMRDYHREVAGYTSGYGRLFCTPKGYLPCHNAKEVIASCEYDPERDADHPTGSIFCSHGAGYHVPWDQVKAHMHVESLVVSQETVVTEEPELKTGQVSDEEWIDTDEVDRILERTYHANRRGEFVPHKGITRGNRKKRETIPAAVRTYKKVEKKEDYLLVDGYNIIHAWAELKELAGSDIDAARGRLLDMLCSYQVVRETHVTVVFDAYNLPGHQENHLDYHNIHVVYTKEDQTADQYIERFAHEHKNKYRVTVATSDALEQIIARGVGCALMSASELGEALGEVEKSIQEQYSERQEKGNKTYLLDHLSEEMEQQLEKWKESES